MLYKKIIIVLSSLTLIFLIFVLFNCSTKKSDKDLEYQKAFYKNYKIFAVDIPDSVDFAGEKVAINRFDVRESLDRELLINTYWQSQTVMFIKKANRYFPIVEPILKKYGVPEDFKYLAVAESGFSNNVVSPAGATGVWQFMKASALTYGLEVNDNIDERYNIEKETGAACKLLLEAYKTYKSWTLAAASYNVGMGGLNKQIGLQKTDDYYDLYLNSETARYIYRIISFKIILSNPKKYGYYLRKKDLYPAIPTYTVTVDSAITNLVGFAAKYKISYKLLRDFNPWIRTSTLVNTTKKSYNITIPKEGYLNYDVLLSDVAEENFTMPDSLNK
jgi:membrane-bound lytic murein transglycosylase D